MALELPSAAVVKVRAASGGWGTVRPDLRSRAPVAQRIEHLTTDQKVRGSNPFGRTRSSQVRATVWNRDGYVSGSFSNEICSLNWFAVRCSSGRVRVDQIRRGLLERLRRRAAD